MPRLASKILDWIATSTDVENLVQVRRRAEDRGETGVAEEITARITEIAIARGEDPMTYDFDHPWCSTGLKAGGGC